MRKELVLKNLRRLQSNAVHQHKGILKVYAPNMSHADVDDAVSKNVDYVTISSAIELIEKATIPVYCCECQHRKELLDDTNNVKLFCGRIQCGITNPEVDPTDYCSYGILEEK